MSAFDDAMVRSIRLLLPPMRSATPRHDDGHGPERQAEAEAKRLRRSQRHLAEWRRGGWR